MYKLLLVSLLFFCPKWIEGKNVLTLELYPSYQEESLDLTLQKSLSGSPLVYEEDYQNIRFFSTRLQFESIYRGIYSSLHATLGFLGDGTLEQQYAPPRQSNLNAYLFRVGPSFFTETEVDFGFLAHLTPQRRYQIMLGPYVGFLYFYETFTRKTALQMNEETQSFLQSPFRLQRWGVLLGPALFFFPYPNLRIRARYGYGFLSQKQTLNAEFLLNQGAISMQNRLRITLHGAHEHVGQLSISGKVSKSVSLGISSRLGYFFTGSREGTRELQEKELLTGVETKTDEHVTYRMRQTSFSIGCTLGWCL